MKKIFNLALLTVQLLLFAQSVNAQRWARIYDSPVTVYNFTETVNTAPEIAFLLVQPVSSHRAQSGSTGQPAEPSPVLSTQLQKSSWEGEAGARLLWAAVR